MAKNSYILVKWVLTTKKGLNKRGFFLFELPNELKELLNIPDSILIKDFPVLESRVKSHTKVSAINNNGETWLVREYVKSRKHSVKCRQVLAQSQKQKKAPYTILRFPTIFRLNHICNVLHFLTPKSGEWIKYKHEGSKEIYPYDYELIKIAIIDEISQKDILISFEPS